MQRVCTANSIATVIPAKAGIQLGTPRHLSESLLRERLQDRSMDDPELAAEATPAVGSCERICRNTEGNAAVAFPVPINLKWLRNTAGTGQRLVPYKNRQDHRFLQPASTITLRQGRLSEGNQSITPAFRRLITHFDLRPVLISNAVVRVFPRLQCTRRRQDCLSSSCSSSSAFSFALRALRKSRWRFPNHARH